MASFQNFKTDLDENFIIGEDTYFTSIPERSNFGVAFEDDTTTGYLYAFKVDREGVILDALHIYNVSDVIFKDKPCKINILWTEDGVVALLINDYCHAIVDFGKKAGYCRNCFPESVGEWKQSESRLLTDELILHIFPKE